MRGILITGAAGYLGSRVAERLHALRVPIVATDRRQPPDVRVPYRVADLLDPTCLPELVRNTRCVVHCAGLAHQFGKRAADVQAFWSTNVLVTEQLARAAAQAGVDHFVLISSVSVYGPSAGGLRDEWAACHPTGAYALSKHAAEQQLQQVAAETGMQITMLRLATLYGANDPGNVARLMRAIDCGKFVWIGAGRNLKSLLHVEDAARACCVAALRGPGTRGETVFNVCGSLCTMREVVNELAMALGRKIPRVRVPPALVRSLLLAPSTIGPWRQRTSAWRQTLEKWVRDDAYCGERFQQQFDFRSLVSLGEGLRGEVAVFRGLQVSPALRRAA